MTTDIESICPKRPFQRIRCEDTGCRFASDPRHCVPYFPGKAVGELGCRPEWMGSIHAPKVLMAVQNTDGRFRNIRKAMPTLTDGNVSVMLRRLRERGYIVQDRAKGPYRVTEKGLLVIGDGDKDDG